MKLTVSMAIVALLATVTYGRPQLKLTAREFKAFQTVLGKSKPVSIQSAIPVMAFSDKNPSKFVELPLEKLGLHAFGRGHDQISIAKLIGVEEDGSSGKFHDAFGRGISDGPIISGHVHHEALPISGPLHHEALTVSGPVHHEALPVSIPSIDSPKVEVEIHNKGSRLVPPSQLNFGFKPIYDSPFEDVAFKTGPQIQQVADFKSFSPSPQISPDFEGGFQPVIQELGASPLHSLGGDHASGIVSAGIKFGSAPPKLGGVGLLTEDDLKLDLSSLGQSIDSPLDITQQEFTGGKSGSVSQVDSGENLYRHHVPSSLIPTSGAGPGTTAVGKLLANKGNVNGIDDSEVFTRSVDASSNKDNSIREDTEDKASDLIVLSEPITGEFRSTKALKNVGIIPSRVEPESDFASEQEFDEEIAELSDLSSLKFVRQNGAIVLQRPDEDFENTDFQASSLFASNALRIPKHPNVQLPLQDATGSEQRNIPQVTSFQPQERSGHQSPSPSTVVRHQKPAVSLFNVQGNPDEPIKFVRVDQPNKFSSQSQSFQPSPVTGQPQKRDFSFRPSSKPAQHQRNQKKPPLVPSRTFESQFQQNHQQHQQKQSSFSFSQSSRQQKKPIVISQGQGEQSIVISQGHPNTGKPFQFSQSPQQGQGQVQQQPQRFQQPQFKQQQFQQGKQKQQQFVQQGQQKQQQFVQQGQQNQQQFQISGQQKQQQFQQTPQPFQQQNQQKQPQFQQQGQQKQQQFQQQQFQQQSQKPQQFQQVQQKPQQFQRVQQKPQQFQRVQQEPQQFQQVQQKPQQVQQKQPQQPLVESSEQQKGSRPVIQKIELGDEQLAQLQKYVQRKNQQPGQQPNIGFDLSQLLGGSKSSVQKSEQKTATKQNSGTSIVSAASPFSSLPPSVLQAFGGAGGLAALGGGGGAGGSPQIIVKTLELDAKDADPSSDAFKEALKKATEEARLELGVSSSEELGVGGANLASLFGKRRRKRQLFGGEDDSTAQTLGSALSTGAGLYGLNEDDQDYDDYE